MLVYQSGSAASGSSLVWFDRSGKQLGTAAGPAVYSNPALSPDGKRLAVGIQGGDLNRDIWILDLERGASSKLTFDPKDDLNPTWSPDASRIAFSSDRKGERDLYVKNSSGAGDEELLLSSSLPKNVEDWSRDGRFLIYNRTVSGSGVRLWIFSFETRQSQPFFESRFSQDQAKFAPNGKWIAYRSNETGRSEIYVQTFGPGPRGKWVVSTAGGEEPQWRADGKELFYATPQSPDRIMAVDVTEKNGAFVPGIPHALFEVRLSGNGRTRWVVTPDGKKFLVMQAEEQKPATSLNIILNWPSLLKK